MSGQTAFPMDHLEAVALRVASSWAVELREELPGGHCSRIWVGLDAAGREIALKVPHEKTEEFAAAPYAEAFAAHGGVAVLAADAATGALLMPRLRPGTHLAESSLDEEAAIDVCADLILRLRQAEPRPATVLRRWFAQLPAESDDPLVREARRAADSLIETAPAPVLLHGDLHHFNILRDGPTWRAIDPKGLLGDPAFEIAAFMRNPLPSPPAKAVLEMRLERFQRLLGDPIERLWGWSFAETVSCTLDGPALTEGPWREVAESLWELRRLAS